MLAPDSVTARVWRTAFETCTPLGATIEITLRCNLRCLHCYNFDREEPYPKSRAASELTPPEIVALIDALARAGTLFLSFTGGEALLHPHLEDFVRHARERRFAVRVKTNGTLLTRERVSRLAAAGVLAVDVSLYGARAETHDGFTLDPGSFDRTLAGIRTAKAAGMKVRAGVCVLRTNAAEMDELVGLIDSLGVVANLDTHITPRYDGGRDPVGLRVDAETLERLYRGPLRHLVDAPDCSPDRSVQCSCARSVVAIASNGDVYPCIGAPLRAGNVREQPFAEIWATSPVFRKIRGLTLDDFTACKPCPDRPYCRRSSGVVYVSTGEYTGPEEWTCMEASVLHRIADGESDSAPASPGVVTLGTRHQV
jgi:radical SAM protein with 4Fe4S-binding SPASM domain